MVVSLSVVMIEGVNMMLTFYIITDIFRFVNDLFIQNFI